MDPEITVGTYRLAGWAIWTLSNRVKNWRPHPHSDPGESHRQLSLLDGSGPVGETHRPQKSFKVALGFAGEAEVLLHCGESLLGLFVPVSPFILVVDVGAAARLHSYKSVLVLDLFCVYSHIMSCLLLCSWETAALLLISTTVAL